MLSTNRDESTQPSNPQGQHTIAPGPSEKPQSLQKYPTTASSQQFDKVLNTNTTASTELLTTVLAMSNAALCAILQALVSPSRDTHAGETTQARNKPTQQKRRRQLFKHTNTTKGLLSLRTWGCPFARTARSRAMQGLPPCPTTSISPFAVV